jgi:hypothetical protein
MIFPIGILERSLRMSNNVINVFTAYGYTSAIDEELTHVQAELKASAADLGSPRTVWEPTENEPLRFISAWGPDTHLQEQLLRRLAAVDAAVIVENAYCEEFLQAVGVQLSWLENGEIKSVIIDGELSANHLPEAEELARCEAELERLENDSEPSDLSFDEYIAARGQFDESIELFVEDYQEECRLHAFSQLTSVAEDAVPRRLGVDLCTH